MFKFVSEFFYTVGKIIYPPSCAICGKYSTNYICETCINRVNKLKICRLYSSYNQNFGFDKIFYFFKYKGIIRKLLLNYKFNNRPYIHSFFAEFILNCEKKYDFFSTYDIIIPVPMDEDKKLKRGYNQTELITNYIVKKRLICDGKNYIKKVKKTKTQSLLNSYERKINVKDAFCINNEYSVIGKKIIIFDDIYTTGATINEISKLLKSNGASEILVLILAKD